MLVNSTTKQSMISGVQIYKPQETKAFSLPFPFRDVLYSNGFYTYGHRPKLSFPNLCLLFPTLKASHNCCVSDTHLYAAPHWWVGWQRTLAYFFRCLKYFCEVEIRGIKLYFASGKIQRIKAIFPRSAYFTPVTEEHKTIWPSSKMVAGWGHKLLLEEQFNHFHIFHTWKGKFSHKAVKMGTFTMYGMLEKGLRVYMVSFENF